MNYFPFHIGDYARDTAHLSILEDGAYRRLLDLYYSTEKPLAKDRAKLYRLVRAQSKAERTAVDTVLGEFFIDAEDGWAHTRCDAEIEKAKESSEENEAKKRNERERQERYRKRRREVFDALRAYDCIPKWDAPMDELERLLSQYQTRSGNVPVTRDSTLQSHDQPRLSNNQEPITNKENIIPADAGAALWEFGVTVLKDQGVKEASARSFLGSILKDYEEKHVESALRAAVGKANAKAYIVAVLKDLPKRGQQFSIV